MNLQEIQTAVGELNEWNLEVNVLVKDFQFTNFSEAMAFVNKVADIAEKENHHPDIMINYNRVRLSLTTHSAHGLTQKDFDVAKHVDALGP